jgi:hypothetical protein
MHRRDRGLDRAAVTSDLTRSVQHAAEGTTTVAAISEGSNNAAVETDHSAADVIAALGQVKGATDRLNRRIDHLNGEVAASSVVDLPVNVPGIPKVPAASERLRCD